jgi:hypothetical protein
MFISGQSVLEISPGLSRAGERRRKKARQLPG